MSYNSTYKIPTKKYHNPSQSLGPGRLFENQILQQTVDENEKWLNTDEAAHYLRVTPNALRILVHRARVRAYKFGCRLRFKKSDLFSVLQLKED
jgi:excisionase family DNA binding protein